MKHQLAVGTLIAAMVAVGVGNVSASNWYGATSGTGCSAGNMQDNNDMSYIRSGLVAPMYNATAYALNNAVAPTDINVGTESGSIGSQTDVVYFDADYSIYCGKDWHPDDPLDPDTSFVVGFAECKTLAGSKCDKFEVRYDTSRTAGYTDTAARKLACHETGHTLGLKHASPGDPTCMADDVNGVTNVVYSPHDRIHVDGAY